jgi:hypothetical protein
MVVEQYAARRGESVVELVMPYAPDKRAQKKGGYGKACAKKQDDGTHNQGLF